MNSEALKKWQDLSYLSEGNHVQKSAYNTLTEHGIMDKLSGFNPVLVGTIPIEINIETSDLDIACEVHQFDEFEQQLHSLFSHYPDYHYWIGERLGLTYAVGAFKCAGFEIEVFGQPLKTYRQNGFRHMLMEHRLLKLYGEKVRQDIIQLKDGGLKTEPAFATYFGLKGDPYLALLELEQYLDDEELRAYLKQI